MTTNHLTSADQRAMRHFITEQGYADLMAWAMDSGYVYDEDAGSWYDEDDSPVDLEIECFHEYERQGEFQDEVRYG